MTSSTKQFKRMALIEEEELKRLRAKQITGYDPNVRSIVDKEEEKLSVLLDDTIAPREKLARLEILTTHEENAKRNYGALSSGALVSAPKRATTASAATATADESTVADADAVDVEEGEITPTFEEEAEQERHASVSPLLHAFAGVPSSKSKNQTARVQSLMAQHDNIVSTNERGEFVYRDQAIPNSDFESLVRWLYVPSASANTTGSATFLTALAEIGVTPKDVSNPTAKQGIDVGYRLTPSHRQSRSRSKPHHSHTSTTRVSSPDIGQLGRLFASTTKRSTSKHSVKKKEEAESQSGHGLSLPPGKRPRILYVYSRR